MLPSPCPSSQATLFADSSGTPDDVELLKKLLNQKLGIIANNEIIISGKDTTIAELQKLNDLLMELVRLLRHHRSARSSEKWTEEDKKQLRIFNEAEMGHKWTKPEIRNSEFHCGIHDPGVKKKPANLPNYAGAPSWRAATWYLRHSSRNQ